MGIKLCPNCKMSVRGFGGKLFYIGLKTIRSVEDVLEVSDFTWVSNRTVNLRKRLRVLEVAYFT